MPWSRIKSPKNGFQAGSRDHLLPSSRVKAWLAFLRIFVEVEFQVLGNKSFYKMWCLIIVQTSQGGHGAARQADQQVLFGYLLKNVS